MNYIRMKRIIILILILVIPLVGVSVIGRKGYVVTPEDFGCVSDDIKKADNNSKRLQKMVDFAAEKGLKIVANGNKNTTYLKGLLLLNLS